jgi:hypothetical protein
MPFSAARTQDLDRAHAADADRIQPGIVTQHGHVDLGEARRIPDRGPLGNRDLAAVDGQRDG